MAVRKAVLFFGDSNMSGLANLSGVPDADFERWTGLASWPTGAWPAGPTFTDFPKDVSVSDVLMLSANMPHTPADPRNVTAVPALNQITLDGANLVAADQDAWVYLAENSTGYGQTLRINTDPTGGTIVTVLDPLTGGNPFLVVAADGDCHILTGSHTVASAAHVVGEDQTVITKTALTADFAAVADDYLIVIATAVASVAAFELSRRVVSSTATTITVSPRLTALPAAGDGIREITAANTVRKIADLSVAANCAFRPLRFYHDAASSFSGPADVWTGQSFPWRNPQEFLSNDAVNGVPEVTWALKAHVEGPLYVIHEAAGGATASPNPAQEDFSGVDTSYSYGLDLAFYDFRPASVSGPWEAMIARLTAAKAIAVAAGDTLDIVAIVSNLGTNDAATTGLAAHYEESMGFIVDTLRAYLVANSLTTLTASRIPFALTAVNATLATRPEKATVNSAQLSIAASRPGVFVIDSSGFALQGDDIHLSAAGQVSWGQAFYAGWLIEQEDHTTLTVETGTGSATANSYATLAQADTFHLELGGNPVAWSGATVEARNDALRQATAILDEEFGGRWRGTVTTFTQALLWPRYQATDERGYTFLGTEIPVALVRATAEVALRIINGDDLRPDIAAGDGSIGASTITVGPISISDDSLGAASVAIVMPEVMQKLRGLLKAGSGAMRPLTR